MRISSDASSWHADGVLRRDARASRDSPEVPRGPRSVSATGPKNTRRWCKGRVGVDHHLVEHRKTVTRMVRNSAGAWVRRAQVEITYRCAGCGKPESSKMAIHVRAAVHPELARHLELAERWCGDGHLYDVAPRYSWSARTIRVCVMCGWCPNTHTAIVVNEPGATSRGVAS